MATQHESFGERLRRLREAAGLTQEALAEAAGLSASAIAVLERGERRRPYPHTVRALTDALRLSEEDRAALFAAVPARTTTVLPMATPSPNVSSPSALGLDATPTALIGRESDLANIAGLLREGARLVTLTGPGGVGKTRLALQAGMDASTDFMDGVIVVSLAPLADPALVVPTVAHTLGLQGNGGTPVRDAVRDYLGERHLLLVLDNFEHVVEASREIADLLVSCPGVVVLTTSRSPLRLRREREYPVAPLGVPDLGRVPTLEEVATAPAVRLFLERAREVSPQFDLTRSNAAVIAAICRRLDGLPLALELAAAKIRLLSPTTLLARLDHALPLLTGGARDLPERQQAMRATIEWSYNLLDEPQQRLLNRLAVFRGGWDLDAAEAVGAAGAALNGDVLDLLEQLVEQSLVMAKPGNGLEQRYRLLVPIREYAEARLGQSDEEDVIRHAHATWYLALALQADREMWGAQHGAWLARLDAEQDNLRAVLQWTVERGDVETGLRLTYALWKFIRSQGQVSEMRQWQAQLLEAEGTVSPDVRAKALWLAGDLAGLAGDYETAARLLEESLPLSSELGDEAGIAKALYLLGNVAEDLGDVERETMLYEDALAQFQAVGDPWWIPEAMAALGRATRKCGHYTRARELHEQALALQRDTHSTWGVAWGMTALGELAADEDEPVRAAALFAEALRLHVEDGEQMGMMFCLIGLGKLAAVNDSVAAAALLLGAAEALRDARGLSLPQDHRAPHDRCVLRLRAGLGEPQFTELWEEGRTLTLDQTLESAATFAATLARRARATADPAWQVPTGNHSTSDAGGTVPLSPREREVLRLIVAGQTDRQIAETLFISHRTAQGHVAHIFNKLGVNSRTSAATAGLRLGLVSDTD